MFGKRRREGGARELEVGGEGGEERKGRNLKERSLAKNQQRDDLTALGGESSVCYWF